MGVFPYPDIIVPLLLDFDIRPRERRRVMRFYKGSLKRHQYIRQEHANQHYLSKNPAFSSRVDALYETFPDARFIYLVRNPFKVVPSMASYARSVWGEFQGEDEEFPHDEHIWNVIRKFYTYTLDRLDQAPPESYIIVKFDDLTSDPHKTIHEIYDHFGLEIDEKFEELLVEATEAARRYESSHTYSVKDTNITPQQIIEEFGDILKRFGFKKPEKV
jgi:hypothetical protein